MSISVTLQNGTPITVNVGSPVEQTVTIQQQMVFVSAAAVVIALWGGILGTLTNQADLQSALDAKEDSLGFTPENVANKITAWGTPTDDQYPSAKLAKDTIDAIDHDALVNFEPNEHIDWTNAADAFVTTQDVKGGSFTIGAVTLDSGEWGYLNGQDQAVKIASTPIFGGLTLQGGQIVDVDAAEAFLVRKDNDAGDVFIVDTANKHVYIGTYANITNISWRVPWVYPTDTTTGVLFNTQWKRVEFNACGWMYIADFYGFSKTLVAVNPAGFQFISRWNDSLSSYNEVALTFEAHDASDLTIGKWVSKAVQAGDFKFLKEYSDLVYQIAYSSKDITLADGVDINFDITTGTMLGTTASQKLGFWGATPIIRPTVTGAKGGNIALANLLTALANMGLLVDSTT